jgi:arylsulfatase A-like enzyme
MIINHFHCLAAAPTFRRLLRSIVKGVAAGLMLGAAGPVCPAASPSERPNILFIMADDLGYGDLACYGAPDVRTPNIDRLAREGVRMTDFYANGPTCSPTRYAFMTGQYQQRGGLEYALFYQEMDAGLPPDGRTVGKYLQQSGYATALIGKWHLGYNKDRAPNRQGFDHFFGLLGGNHDYFRHVDKLGYPDLFLNEEPVGRPGEYSTDLFTDAAIDYLRERKSQPFFLYLSYNAPHFPFQGPNDADLDIRPNTAGWSAGTRERYINMVERLDEGVGKVLAELEKLGLSSNTLVVFTSDNGGDPRGRNLPLRGIKGSVWEGGIRVPCIARLPGRIKPGSTSGQVGITMDWTSSLVSLAGVAARDLDGIDILPILAGERTNVHRTLFWRRVPEPVRKGVGSWRAVREGPWKLVQDPDRKPALFNLANDISETADLADKNPDLVAHLLLALDRWEASLPAENPPAYSARTER